MDLIEYFSNNHANLLFLLAGITLVIELGIIGLSGLLIFFSIACFITALLIHFGVLSGWEAEIFSVGVFTLLAALFLWKPLKKFQSKIVHHDNSSDMIGREVTCVETITKTSGAVRHSGINWPAHLNSNIRADSIDEKDRCTIVGVDGNIMLVKPL